MHSQESFKRILVNAPIPVNFAGLRGNTANMQADGWQLNVEIYSRPDLRFSYEVRLAGKHPDLGLYFYSGVRLFDGVAMMQDRDYIYNAALHMEFPICANHMTQNIIMPASLDVTRFPVDFSKSYIAEIPKQEMFNMNDLFLFKPMNPEAEIFLPEKEILSVQDHLNAVLEMQSEKQAEIREKKRKERARIGRVGQETKPGELIAKNEVKLQLVMI